MNNQNGSADNNNAYFYCNGKPAPKANNQPRRPGPRGNLDCVNQFYLLVNY